MQAVVNGVRMHWLDEGAGDPIVFIHGFPFSSAMWHGQLSAIPAGWRGIAPDLRGFGKTPGVGVGPYTMDQYADDVAALLGHLNLERAVICGFSMGGYVALAFWRRHQSKVRALLLASTKATADTEEGKKGRADLASRARAQGTAPVVDAMLPKLIGPLALRRDPALAGKVRALMESNQPESMARALEGMALRPNSEPVLRDIDVAALVLHGEEDAIIPRGEVEIMTRAIRGGRLELFEHGGHVINLEQPVVFNRYLKGFLDHLAPDFGPLSFKLTD